MNRVAKCIAIIWWLQQNKQTKTVSIRKPAPPIFFSIQCCHEVGKAPSFALVLWIDDGCYGTFVDWILTRVPFGVHLFLLKLCKLSAVVDDHEQFPDEQQGEANEHNAGYHTCHNGNDVRSRRAVQFLYHIDLLGGILGDGVGVIEPAVVGILLLAVGQGEALVCGLGQIFTVRHLYQVEVAAVLLAFLFLLAFPKCSALHTVFLLSADTGTGRTDLARRPLEFGFGAFADSALANTAAVTELPVLGEAGGVIQRTITGAACVVGLTDALPALTASMSSAELVVGAVAVEVVALAVLATVNFCRILPLLAFAGATDAVAVVATDIRSVVFPAVGIEVLCPDFIFAALTFTPDTSLVTLACSTLEDPVSPVALLAVGHSFFGALTVADEIENYLHLLVEALGFKCNDLRLAIQRTLI